MKKVLCLVLISLSLYAEETTLAQEKIETAELKAAKVQAEEAKIELEAAKKKLAAANESIKKSKAELEAKDGGEAVYTTKTELSYSNTKGNTNTERFALDFHGERKRKKHIITLDVDALTSSSNGNEDNNKWLAVLQYDRELTEKAFLNYLVSYGEDKFSGFDYQFNTGPGIRYKLFNTEEHKLDLRTNILYSKDKLDDGTVNEYGAFLAGFQYKWNILENLAFIQNAFYKVEVDQSNNYFVMSKTAIESKINGTFSLGMSYKVDYKNQPPSSNKRTDRTFLASFIINY